MLNFRGKMHQKYVGCYVRGFTCTVVTGISRNLIFNTVFITLENLGLEVVIFKDFVIFKIFKQDNFLIWLRFIYKYNILYSSD